MLIIPQPGDIYGKAVSYLESHLTLDPLYDLRKRHTLIDHTKNLVGREKRVCDYSDTFLYG